MKRFAAVSALGAVALLAMAAPGLATTEPFTIDPVHSNASFSIRHFFSRVTGRFNLFSGTIQLDQKDLANSSVEATIQAASIFTNNDRRDKDLRSSHFFSVDSFPTITFKSTKITPGENGTFKLEGDLTMHGVTKPVALDAALLGAGPVGMMGYRAGFEASLTIDRKDFGIVWNQVLDQGGTMLGDDVAINLAIEAVKAEPGKSAAASSDEKRPGKK